MARSCLLLPRLAPPRAGLFLSAIPRNHNIGAVGAVDRCQRTTVHGPYAASRNPRFGAVDAVGHNGGVEAT